MNHCRDCNSDYASPGTCNCFAVGGKRSTTPALGYWPPYPYAPWYPWALQPYYYPPQPYTITTTPATGGTLWISGNSVRADQVSAAISFTVDSEVRS